MNVRSITINFFPWPFYSEGDASNVYVQDGYRKAQEFWLSGQKNQEKGYQKNQERGLESLKEILETSVKGHS